MYRHVHISQTKTPSHWPLHWLPLGAKVRVYLLLDKSIDWTQVFIAVLGSYYPRKGCHCHFNTGCTTRKNAVRKACSSSVPTQQRKGPEKKKSSSVQTRPTSPGLCQFSLTRTPCYWHLQQSPLGAKVQYTCLQQLLHVHCCNNVEPRSNCFVSITRD